MYTVTERMPYCYCFAVVFTFEEQIKICIELLELRISSLTKWNFITVQSSRWMLIVIKDREIFTNLYYHQYTRPNSKLPSSKHVISGHKWPCAGGKFIYRPAPYWLRRRRTTAIAQSESACKGGASLTGRSSCFFYREQFSRSFWDGGNSEFRRLKLILLP